MTDTVSRQTMDNETLPESWTISVLDEVAEVITGNTPSKRDKSNYGHDLPLVKPGELLDRPVAKAEDNLSEKGAKLARILPPTAVLVSCIGNLGKTAISQVPVAFNQQINAAVFSEAVIPKFGFYYLQTGEVRNWMEKHASATTVTILNKGKFSKLPFPIAPFNEQRRIVEKIEELFTKLDAGVRSLEQTRALLKSYRRSVLKAAVEGELSREWREAHRDEIEPASERLERILQERREKFAGQKYKEPAAPDTSELPALPEGWAWATLPQLGELNRGKSKHRPRNASFLYGGPYPFVQTGDIREAEGTIREYRQSYTEEGLKQSRLWPRGTLCITIAANIAETALLGFDACFPDSVVGFLPESDHCSVAFVEYFMRTARERLDRYAPATAHKNINL
ncbi:MAG: restriction endonuclease subunit S [Rubrobacteraceae bacterium]